MSKLLHLGTCSWKYPSWKGLVYSKAKPENYLAEYCSSYSTVEVDQWFWSLFSGNNVVLPKPEVVEEYARSTPEEFRFGIKIPNSITLTHHYSKNKSLTINPHFLSIDLMHRFLESIKPLWDKLGPLIFQFEYLNKKKMASHQEFLDRFGEFTTKLPKNFLYAVETRNPNYLNRTYFEFLRSHDINHVFLQGYYMPSIFDIYQKFGGMINHNVVIRLLGPDRKEIEDVTKKKWDSRVAPREEDLDKLVKMLQELHGRGGNTFIYVNNHFEGSAPRTISRLKEKLR